MDTREKIVGWERAVELACQGRWLVVGGLFDPLTAAQAKRLASFTQEGRQLMVVIEADEEALLATSARAALVAGVRGVAAVTLAPLAAWRDALSSYPHVEVWEDLIAERQRSAEFVELVLRRQRSAEVAAGEKL